VTLLSCFQEFCLLWPSCFELFVFVFGSVHHRLKSIRGALLTASWSLRTCDLSWVEYSYQWWRVLVRAHECFKRESQAIQDTLGQFSCRVFQTNSGSISYLFFDRKRWSHNSVIRRNCFIEGQILTPSIISLLM